MDSIATLDPNNSKIWLGYGLIITENSGDDDHVDFDCDSEMLETFAPYESYGSDLSQAGYDFYNVAGNSPITFDRLVAMRDDMVKHHAYMQLNPYSGVELGCLYDSDDGTYSAWEDLDDEYQTEIREFYKLQAENGETFREYSNDSHCFYGPYTFSACWVDSLNSAIKSLSPHMK